MPRITPLRLVISAVSAYFCLLGLWLALPFPGHTVQDGGYAYHERTLKSGKTLTTVHETHPGFFSYDQRVNTIQRFGCAIDWRLVPHQKTNSILLQIGESTTVNLTDVALPNATPWTEKDHEVRLRTGDTDGANPPWFAYADAVLLYWDIHHDTLDTALRVVHTQSGQVQIRLAKVGQPEYTSILPPTATLFATLSNVPTQGNMLDVQQITVSDMAYDVPSRTYLIRHYIIIFLAPVTLAIVAIAGPLSTICFAIAYLGTVTLTVYCVILYVCWAFNGFPPWSDFKDQFILTKGWSRRARHRRRTIWGVSGPLPEDGSAASDEGEFYDQPIPLTSVAQFFRSTSPLDDFCATFECTKWMVKPIRRKQVEESALLERGRQDVKGSSKAQIKITSFV